jgi:hypothetical protein
LCEVLLFSQIFEENESPGMRYDKGVVDWTDTMAAKDAKQVVFIYNGDNNNPDIEFDMDGEIDVPPDNSIIVRKGKNWKVVRHTVESTVAGPKAVPILRINLTDQF